MRIIINIWKGFLVHDICCSSVIPTPIVQIFMHGRTVTIMRIIPIEILGNVCIIEFVDEAFNFRTTERRN